MNSEPCILYVADPMCSWCWGFAPVLSHLEEIAEGVPLQYVLGGLAPDSDQPMDPATRSYVQQAWRDVEARTGAQFNFDFWKRCAPRRSTWPACRAVLLARDHGQEQAMFRAIQAAYYRDARNPSDDDVLADLAHDLGIDRQEFTSQLHADATKHALEQDFELRRELGASSFPSLGVRHAGKLHLLHSGWCDEEQVAELWGRWTAHAKGL